MDVTLLHSSIDMYVGFFDYLDRKISVVDASIIYDSVRHRLEILSFDEELLRIEASL